MGSMVEELSKLLEQSQASLIELYKLRASASLETTQLTLGWDILELYLARGAKSHSWSKQLEWLQKSSTLNSLYQVLLKNADFRRSLSAIESVCPIEYQGGIYDFQSPGNLAKLLTVVRLAVETIFTSTLDADLQTNLVKVSNDVLGLLIKELVPCN
jgi:hypothetical protein